MLSGSSIVLETMTSKPQNLKFQGWDFPIYQAGILAWYLFLLQLSVSWSCVITDYIGAQHNRLMRCIIVGEQCSILAGHLWANILAAPLNSCLYNFIRLESSRWSIGSGSPMVLHLLLQHFSIYNINLCYIVLYKIPIILMFWTYKIVLYINLIKHFL